MGQNGGAIQQNAVIYARVSSKEQEIEGYSIDAQLDLLRRYAQTNGIVVLQEFVDVESAGASGRTKFGEMLSYFKKSGTKCRSILVEKLDRLYRNPYDAGKVGELGITIGFVKDKTVLGPDSGSNDHLMHDIKVAMSSNYLRNLREETKKGQRQKAKAGLWPSFAPTGYRNTEGPDGRRIIVPNGDAITITRLFEEFAIGSHSLKTLAAKARAERWDVSGRRLHQSTLHLILRRRLYCGDIEYDGITCKGTHEALVSREVWDQVQALLGRRAQTKSRRVKHNFAFTGFVRCGHCGCGMVGELKTKKTTNKGYIYYHCTGYHGKCGEPYTPEKVVEERFGAALKELVIPPGTLKWLQSVLSESDLNERAARDREVKRLEEQSRRIESKLDMLYEDRLEGRISSDTYDRKSADVRIQSQGLTRRVEEIRAAAPAPVKEAINLMSLTSRAAELFATQPPHEKQAFLRLVLRSASWKNGQLETEFESPFEDLRHSNRLTLGKQKQLGANTTAEEEWLLR